MMRKVTIPTLSIMTIGRIGNTSGDNGQQPSVGEGVDNLLTEDGASLLLEDRGVMLLETQVVKQISV